MKKKEKSLQCYDCVLQFCQRLAATGWESVTLRKAQEKIWAHKKDQDGFRRRDRKYYDFGEDFLYDTFPLPAEVADERNVL